jgi:Fe-S cluster assembly ATP-binding protein
MLAIKNLSVSFNGKILLENINLTVKNGTRHLLQGANGSGKTTLARVIAGDPDYKIESGQIIFGKKNITDEDPTTRALLGIFLGAQVVPEIPGLSVMSFLKHSMSAHHHFNTGKDLSMSKFLKDLETAREKLNIPKEWLNRGINVGFSGGEKKRLMFLQLLMSRPQLAILDEPDSGTDKAAQKLFADIINKMTDTTFIIVSHQSAFTEMISITDTTVLRDGRIVVE